MTPRDRAKQVMATYSKVHARRPLRKQFALEDLISAAIAQAVFECEEKCVAAAGRAARDLISAAAQREK